MYVLSRVLFQGFESASPLLAGKKESGMSRRTSGKDNVSRVHLTDGPVVPEHIQI